MSPGRFRRAWLALFWILMGCLAASACESDLVSSHFPDEKYFDGGQGLSLASGQGSVQYGFTVTMWVKVGTYLPETWFVKKGVEDCISYGVGITNATDGDVGQKPRFTINFQPGYNADHIESTWAPLPLDTWTHLTLVVGDDKRYGFFRNGTQGLSWLWVKPWTGVYPCDSGDDLRLGEEFMGYLQDVRIYNTSLTDRQIRSVMEGRAWACDRNDSRSFILSTGMVLLCLFGCCCLPCACILALAGRSSSSSPAAAPLNQEQAAGPGMLPHQAPIPYPLPAQPLQVPLAVLPLNPGQMPMMMPQQQTLASPQQVDTQV